MTTSLTAKTKRLSVLISSLVIISGVGLLASCGGGGSSNTPTSTVQGKVIDGYIANATICLDTNKNFKCDDGEPTTTTDATGAYTLVFPGSVDNQIILAIATQDSSDLDNNGLTLLQADRTGFTLAAPATNASVISPLTTLVSLDLLSNITAPITGERIAASEKAVQAALSNSDPIMGFDFIKAGNNTLHQQHLHDLATVIAAALPESYGLANTAVRGVVAETVSDAQIVTQTVYRATRDGVYAALALVVDKNTGADNALLFSRANAVKNVATTVNFFAVSGVGADVTIQLALPSRSYLDDTLFHASACPSNLTDQDCFVRQEFVQ